MDLTQAIMERRSIRNFTDQPVSEDDLAKVLEAVRWSPSWANTQVWEVVVVKDQATKEALQGTLGRGNPASKAMLAAPLVLVLCGRLKDSGYYKGVVSTKFGDWFMFDLGLACQSLCLTAHDLGLGTVVVGLFDQDKAAGVVGLPEGYEVVAMLPMGHPSKVPSPPKRKEAAEFTHYEKF